MINLHTDEALLEKLREQDRDESYRPDPVMTEVAKMLCERLRAHGPYIPAPKPLSELDKAVLRQEHKEANGTASH